MGGGNNSPFDMGDDDFEEDEGAGSDEEEGNPEEDGEAEQTEGESAGGGEWDKIEARHNGDAIKKSLGSRGAVRIMILFFRRLWLVFTAIRIVVRVITLHL
jgi:hypothetical protein